ncbi:MAG: FxsA family protein [Gammaproteobacteria bacterium]|nr:FxsA family protein [Gammaproteobacteria bacterium]
MLYLLFLLIPVAEIAVFIQVGSRLGVGTTLLLVLASAVFGIWLIRVQGFAAATRVQAMIARGESPALGMLEGLALLAAGVLLLIPGFLTDVAAFVLLIPPLRRAIIRVYMRHIRLEGAVTQHYPGKEKPGRTPLEGESRRED